jgi:hypothetical protein
VHFGNDTTQGCEEYTYIFLQAPQDWKFSEAIFTCKLNCPAIKNQRILPDDMNYKSGTASIRVKSGI